jgi:glycosyltransferase involved in cell wall biosynthesis
MAALPSPDRHGAQLRNVVRALAPRLGVDVMALKRFDQPVVERYLKARILRVPAGEGPLPEQIDAFRRAVARQLEGSEYDVIHFRDAWSGLPICERKDDLPGRLIFDIALSPLGEPRAADGELAARLSESEAFCLGRADLILVATETARRHLERAGLGERAVVVPPGVDVDHFDWEPAPKAIRPVVLYGGRIAPGRRVRLLLAAAGLLSPRLDLEVWLVGPLDPSLRKPLDEAVRELGLVGRVRELGAVDHEDMPRVLAQASVCVVPAAPDAGLPLAGPPTKLLEAMACRRPVVAPSVPCIAEIVRQGSEGLLFEPNDAADLARCLERILTDSSFAAELAAAGHRAVRERHPASAARRRLLEAYGRLLPAGALRPVAAAGETPIDALPAHADTVSQARAGLLDVPELASDVLMEVGNSEKIPVEDPS